MMENDLKFKRGLDKCKRLHAFMTKQRRQKNIINNKKTFKMFAFIDVPLSRLHTN